MEVHSTPQCTCRDPSADAESDPLREKRVRLRRLVALRTSPQTVRLAGRPANVKTRPDMLEQVAAGFLDPATDR